MPALFPRWTNTALRLWLGAGALGLLSVPLGAMIYVRTSWNTQRDEPVDQPVQFDHRHHVQDDHIDCIYCHSSAETTRYAGVPATEVCMGCHSQIWNESPLLEVVRRSYFSDKPIPYNRVHDLGDFVYFDHSVHVRGGVACVSCHGRVDGMARVYKAAPLSMTWCLECHRRQEQRSDVGPPRALYDPLAGELFAPSEAASLDEPLAVSPLTTCSACHR